MGVWLVYSGILGVRDRKHRTKSHRNLGTSPRSRNACPVALVVSRVVFVFQCAQEFLSIKNGLIDSSTVKIFSLMLYTIYNQSCLSD